MKLSKAMCGNRCDHKLHVISDKSTVSGIGTGCLYTPGRGRLHVNECKFNIDSEGTWLKLLAERERVCVHLRGITRLPLGASNHGRLPGNCTELGTESK